MNVYILFEIRLNKSFDTNVNHGVFSTRKVAETFARELLLDEDCPTYGAVFRGESEDTNSEHYLSVEEFKVDVRVGTNLLYEGGDGNVHSIVL
tara:strand:+ start:1044 stop:1322 length:279 start_codon:yes stop_codon:yes gene_type:complete